MVHTVLPSASKALSGCLSGVLDLPVHHRLLTRQQQQFESEGYVGSALNRLGGFVNLLGRGASHSDSFEAVRIAATLLPKVCLRT